MWEIRKNFSHGKEKNGYKQNKVASGKNDKEAQLHCTFIDIPTLDPRTVGSVDFLRVG